MRQKLNEIYEQIKVCNKCSLGGTDMYALPRGNPNSRLMIVAEAPGKVEGREHSVLIGPAGKLLDKVWQSVGWDTNDWHLTNICNCRPYMPRGSGKENYTPLKEQQEKCIPYLIEQIKLIDPKVIITLGKTATKIMIGPINSMNEVRGKITDGILCHPDGLLLKLKRYYRVFPMWHPAYLLRNPNGPAKQQMWDDIKKLKQIVEELK